jgi:hypothetical protein
MRVRKRPRKELVGGWVPRVVFFFEQCLCHLMGNTKNLLWQGEVVAGRLGSSWSLS